MPSISRLIYRTRVKSHFKPFFYLCQFIFFPHQIPLNIFPKVVLLFLSFGKDQLQYSRKFENVLSYLFKRYKNEFQYPYFVWKENNRKSLLYILKLRIFFLSKTKNLYLIHHILNHYKWNSCIHLYLFIAFSFFDHFEIYYHLFIKTTE